MAYVIHRMLRQQEDINLQCLEYRFPLPLGERDEVIPFRELVAGKGPVHAIQYIDYEYHSGCQMYQPDVAEPVVVYGGSGVLHCGRITDYIAGDTQHHNRYGVDPVEESHR